MAYLQVKTVLDRVQRLRQAVCDYAEHHRQKAGDPMLEGVFEVIRNHEAQMGATLAGYELDSDHGLLETWIQYSGAESLASVPTDFATQEEPDHEVVLQIMLEAEESLAETLIQAERQPHAPRLQELFAELKVLQDHHLRAIANCVSELKQTRGD